MANQNTVVTARDVGTSYAHLIFTKELFQSDGIGRLLLQQGNENKRYGVWFSYRREKKLEARRGKLLSEDAG